MLEADQALEIRYSGSLRRVRAYFFRYVAWVPGGNTLLKYHNMHRGDDWYHHRVYNPVTGREILYERLHRHQFPTFSEVLDELEIVAGRWKNELGKGAPHPQPALGGKVTVWQR